MATGIDLWPKPVRGVEQRSRIVKLTACLVLRSLLAATPTSAIVIRHDVPDSKYRISAAECPVLVELPGEGQGVLISPRWIVTAAHAVTWRAVHEVTINGSSRPVAQVIVHPGYKKAPEKLESGDAAALMAFKAMADDIALIKLDRPVNDVRPVSLYRGSREKGETVEIIGRGATGNGLVGEYPHSPHRGELRREYSRVISADGRWLGLKFEAPPRALPLEGMPADGDSGGPVLIEADSKWQLAGLVSRKYATGDLSKFRYCLYGQITYQIRISYYAAWIDHVIAANP